MEQKATVTFDVLPATPPEVPDSTDEELGRGVGTTYTRPLVIAGELLPHTEQEHAALAALLDEANPPQVSAEFKNTNGVISYALKFERV